MCVCVCVCVWFNVNAKDRSFKYVAGFASVKEHFLQVSRDGLL